MKNISMLTSKNAVLQAIEECNKMGRDEFLKHYGFKYSRLYPLKYKERIYDSKAIAGVAFGKQHGNVLKAKDFSGGIATVVPTLLKLGFSASQAQHPVNDLTIDSVYFRKDLIEQYGGQLQRGIWTPKEFPVIFIFSGKSGEAYGYEDGWTEDGIYKYTGEGQSGDMSFSQSGNSAIRDHREKGKDILFFEDLGKNKGVRYKGMFECATWEKIDGVDKNGNSRKIIQFSLIPVESTSYVNHTDEEPSSVKEPSIEDLRYEAYAASKNEEAKTKQSTTKKSWYIRSKKVKDYVLARASGVCEACDQPAPFLKKNGEPYLEPHHTKRLADDGPDHPAWVGAICPTCHRRIHSGEDGKEWNKRLQERLEKIENE